MSAGRLLLRGHLRTRWRRHAALSASLSAGLLGFLLVAMVLQGAEEGAVRPLRDLLTGDARITWDDAEIAGGTTLEDYRTHAGTIRSIPGAVVAPRWETSQVTVQNARPENWTGGLLVGIDPTIDEERDAVAPYLTWGRALPETSLVDPASGRSYAPLIVGEAAARRLNLTRSPDGTPDFSQVFVLTSGRLARPNDLVPLNVQAVVVGTYATGIDSMDRFTAFTHIEEARRLVGGRPGDPSANTLVVHHADAADIARLDLDGATVESPADFAFQVMGNVLVLLRVSAGLAIALVLVVLAAWLVHEAGAAVSRDRLVVAALRAVGIPQRTILASYAITVVGMVAVALVAATLAALLVDLAAPALVLATSNLHIPIDWALRPLPLLAVTATSLGLAAAGAWAAALRLGSVNVADALRP